MAEWLAQVCSEVTRYCNFCNCEHSIHIIILQSHSSTSFAIAGADVTSIYHVGRRVKIIATTPGTIFGTITAVTLFGVFKYNQTPNLYGTIGLVLIIAGVILLNLFGKVK